MADVNKAIEVVFTGVDDMSQSIAKIGGGLNDFTGDLQSVTGPLADMGADILKLEAALVALTAGGLALATAKAGEFGDSFNEISTLIQAPTEDIEAFRLNILDYAKDSTQSIEDINAAVYAAISATGDWENSLDLLTVAEKLAVGGVTDLGSATQLLSTTLNAYGVGVEEASNFSDTFFTIVKDGVTTIPELSTKIANVTALAASASIPFETLGAAISAMTGYGVNTSETMTQLKQAIAAMLAPTDATRAAAELLGVDLGKAAIESKGFETVLTEIYDAAEGDLEIIKKIIPSIEGANAVMILGADAGNKFADALVNQANNAGAAQEAYEKMAENFGLVNQNMANNVNTLLILIGDKILDSYKGMADGVVGILQALATEVETGTFDELFKNITDMGDKLKAQLETIAKNIPAAFKEVNFDALIQSFNDLITAAQTMFNSFFGDIDLTSAEGIAFSIQMIVDSIETLNTVSQGIVEGLTPFVAITGELLREINGLDEGTKELVGQVLGLAMGITPLLGLVGGFGLAVQGGALAVGGITKAIGWAGGTGLAGSMGGLAAILGPLVVLWGTWEAAQLAGGAMYENNTLGIRDMADEVANWIGTMITGVDTQEGLNLATSGGVNLSDDAIAAYKAQQDALAALNAEKLDTPEAITTTLFLQTEFAGDSEAVMQRIFELAEGGATQAEIIAKLKAEYADTDSEKAINWASVGGTVTKFLKLQETSNLGLDISKYNFFFPESDAEREIIAKLGVDYIADQNSKIFDFIVANSDAGATPKEILTALKAEYANTETEALLDLLTVEDIIKLFANIEIQDAQATKDTIQSIFGASEDGVVSFPSRLDLDTSSALNQLNTILYALEGEGAEVGLTFNSSDIEFVKSQIESLTDDIETDFDGMSSTIQGVGGDIVGTFNYVTGQMEYAFEHTGTIAETKMVDPVKQSLLELETEALKKKETIEKALELRASVKVAEFEKEVKIIEAQAALLSEALQIKGEIDLKGLENVGKTIDAIGIALQTSGDIITGAIDSMSNIGKDFGPFSQQMSAILASIESETKLREIEVNSLAKLNEAQVEYMKAKTQALQKGDSIITINADGMEQHIEAFMWEILKKIQMRATENMDEFLLGLP